MANKQNNTGLTVEEIRARIQAYAIVTLLIGVLVAWGWACIVGINS